jgi:hypothetical protein
MSGNVGRPPGPLSLTDRLEIQELIARYNWAIDTRDGVGVANTFTANGIFDGGRIVQGRDQLIAFGELRDRPPTPAGVGSQHWVTNLVLAGDNLRIHARSFFIRHNVVDNGVVASTNLGYYYDEIVYFDGRWLFEKRRWRRWPPADGELDQST